MAVEDLGDALYRAASGRNPSGPDADLAADTYNRSMLDRLRDALGGVNPLARFLGVARTTVQRWFGGAGRAGRPSTPTPESQSLIKLGLRVARGRRNLARLRAASSITISGMDRYDPGRRRSIRLDRSHLSPGWADRTVNGYLTGGSEGARAAFLGSITDRFYRGYFASERDDHGIDIDRLEW